MGYKMNMYAFNEFEEVIFLLTRFFEFRTIGLKSAHIRENDSVPIIYVTAIIFTKNVSNHYTKFTQKQPEQIFDCGMIKTSNYRERCR
ncbi:hypothetical protein TY91_03255 [Secundilactobacillus collinoides]|uniref:Uncharacterized protein n=1 Tax=Secundilactobacillus collinoides TaxID=33960 RepID=A0A166HJQ7_SECCO|nr:hypothetical protein TY91_03255 [Secundilactobacillus collinoides]